MNAGVLETIKHLEVKVCSICGTDLRTCHYGRDSVKLPHILGHEIAGQISAVGSQVSDFQVGDRVAITPRIACG